MTGQREERSVVITVVVERHGDGRQAEGSARFESREESREIGRLRAW